MEESLAELPQGPPSRARGLLATGAALGLFVATAGIVETAPDRGVPDDAAVLVNGVPIREAAYERALAALAQDSREPLSDGDRQHVLDRLIEEELLVQRAQELGLDRSDPVVRNTLVSAMIESIVSGVGQEEPSREEVERFYEDNREFFARTERFWVRQLRFAVARQEDGGEDGAALEKAREAAARLRAGEPISAVGRSLGAASVVPLPDGYLPANKLREYLGPTPAQAATRLASGEVSDPVRGGSAWYVLQMVERVASPPQPLEAVESQVRAEMRRRAGDDSLRAYLDALRADAELRMPAS
jgi:parvulin-like peptidyl-prolyl isomerase